MIEAQETYWPQSLDDYWDNVRITSGGGPS
jgi:hypothetical protein